MEQNKILINEFLVKDSIRIAKDMQELAMEILPIAELINTTKSNLENYAQKCDILSKDGDLESNTLYLEFLAFCSFLLFIYFSKYYVYIKILNLCLVF